MKTILSSKTVVVPPGGKSVIIVTLIKSLIVTVRTKNRVVTVKGRRGTLKKSFRHLNCELTQVGKNKIRVDIWFAKRKQLACLQTICSHIRNLIKGVQYVSLF